MAHKQDNAAPPQNAGESMEALGTNARKAAPALCIAPRENPSVCHPWEPWYHHLSVPLEQAYLLQLCCQHQDSQGELHQVMITVEWDGINFDQEQLASLR